MIVDPRHNVLTQLISPSTLSPSLATDCQNLAKSIANSLGIVGMLAVELMIDTADKIWINEIAPRPHNSGHHTIEAASTSQFEQHIRAVIGAPIADIIWEKPAAMCNILGGDSAGLAYWTGLETVLKHPNAALHLYGKRYSKPHRKMGHLTVIGETSADAMATLQTVSSGLSCNGKHIE
jgi:5-(carboxyamino)imidazole ribonucleotide synthase